MADCPTVLGELTFLEDSQSVLPSLFVLKIGDFCLTHAHSTRFLLEKN
jgi:hypothetical protein